MIAILVVSMVQGVFAQQIIIKGTVKDATSKKAAEYVNVVLQTADSVFVGGTTTNGKGDFLLNKVYAGNYLLALKSATKLFSVLLASKRPLITELADKLRLKYPLLPTISPCPTMRLEAIRSIIPISCRRYPKSV